MFLVINAGSSSLKVALYGGEHSEPIISVSIEDIGSPEAHLVPESQYGTDQTITIDASTHEEAAIQAKQWIESQIPQLLLIRAVGYRIVHGGDRLKEPTVLNPEVIGYLESLTPLAPNHMPATLQCIQVFERIYDDAVHIGCFDTAFFAGVPELAHTLPLPRSFREKGMRRYGFHGLSYEYLLNSFREHEGEAAARGRLIFLHLGSGASISALAGGQPVDMSMGFTPVSGIMMSTRTGDIEPGVLIYMQQQLGLKPDEVFDIVAKQSGLLGISGQTGDMYTLLQSQHEDSAAALAIELFCYTIKKTIGAYTAVLGGVDSIVFTGGIGERSAEIRSRILSGLEFLGIRLDDARNKASGRCISSGDSQTGVHVIPAREDRTILTQMHDVLRKGGL